MKKIVLILSTIFITSCAELRQGEVRDCQCRVLGIDASVPIPFAQGFNFMNVRLGWVETDYIHSYKVKKYVNVKQEVNHLGSVEREYGYGSFSE